jgi:hypothetical protein
MPAAVGAPDLGAQVEFSQWIRAMSGVAWRRHRALDGPENSVDQP